MSVTTTQAVSLLENVLFESSTLATANAKNWATLSLTSSTSGTAAQLAAAMTVTAETSIAEQIVRYYVAALGRTPAGSELSYYVQLAEGSLTASEVAQGASAVSQTTWNSIATGFVNSPEFTSTYGSGNSATLVNLLYLNILGRAPAASEEAYYQAQLTNGYTPATLMQEFANSSEYQAIANSQIATALANHGVASLSGPVTGALPLYGLSADSQATVTEGGTEVFSLKTHGVAAGTTLYYTLSGVTAANVVSGQLTGTITVGSDGNAVIPVALVQTMTNNGGLSGDLSASVGLTEGTANHTIVTVTGTNDTIIIEPASNFYGGIGLGGSSNTAEVPGNGANLTLNLLGGTGTNIQNYSPTSGTGLHIVNTTSAAHASLIDGSVAAVNGATLNFNNGTSYAVLTGSLGDGSSASVLQAINASYKVAGASGEAITFIGQDKAGNTEVWYFGSTAGATQGVIPASSQTGSADVNGNHTIDANELTLVATLTGVKAASLTVADLV